MIFLSTFRNLDSSAEYRQNQLAAFHSWSRIADGIVYFNDYDKRIDSPLTTFVKSPDHPHIKSFVQFAALLDEWSCIINADIILSPDFLDVEKHLKACNAKCAISYRYEFDPTNPLMPKKVMDNGLDIFCAAPEVWRNMLALIPEQYRAACLIWDTWVIGFMNQYYGQDFYDFTLSYSVFHPKHGGRKNPYLMESDYLPKKWWYGPPSRKLI